MRIRLIVRFVAVCASMTVLALPISPTAIGQVGSTSGASIHSLADVGDRFFTRAGVTLHYKEIGTGEAVFLVHGYARNLSDWAVPAETLSTTHRIVAIDVRGFGQSSKFGDPEQFGVRMADDVIHLMDDLRIDRAHIVGQSMGALIAANVAARYPTRAKTVTLIAGPFYSRSEADDQQLIDDLRRGNGLTRLIQQVFPDGDAQLIASINTQVLAQNDLPSLIAVMSSTGALEITEHPAPNVPALIICGTADALLQDSQKLAAWWPGATLVEVAGADHSVEAVFGDSDTTEIFRAFIR